MNEIAYPDRSAPDEPMTLDPGQTACGEVARSMEEADAANSSHDDLDIGRLVREVKSSSGEWTGQRLTFGVGNPYRGHEREDAT